MGETSTNLVTLFFSLHFRLLTAAAVEQGDQIVQKFAQWAFDG
jgi:hypothetical protein